MKDSKKLKIVLWFIFLLIFVVVFSVISSKTWKGKAETTDVKVEFIIEKDMSIIEFAKVNDIPNSVLKEAFSLETQKDLQQKISNLNLSNEEIIVKVDKSLVIYNENDKRNWIKILIKFVLWIIFLVIVFNMIKNGKIKPNTRKILYVIAFVLFGIILGSDPSPMGTVKDAIALYGAKHVIFIPRIISLTVFLLMVILANKFICSWGCQLGTLQDFIFRLNRNKKDNKGIFKQYKIPFSITNSIRIVFFVVFTLVAFLWAYDLVGLVDPFKVFNPAVLKWTGGVFVALVLIASIFVYRPWCHLFCPFGLVGWFVEKLSYFKIKVNYDTCIACENCSKACPSTVMDAILKQDKTIPDCFSCGTCIDICPTDSITFSKGKREKPPVQKFEKVKIKK